MGANVVGFSCVIDAEDFIELVIVHMGDRSGEMEVDLRLAGATQNVFAAINTIIIFLKIVHIATLVRMVGFNLIIDFYNLSPPF